jgi:hypothetical protein
MKNQVIGAIFVLAFGVSDVLAQVGLPDDGASHPPPAIGPYGYNSFIPGAGYVDPVFGTNVQRVTSDDRPDDIYSHNKMWNADGTRYLHLDQIINVASGVPEFTGIPLGAYSFDRGFDPVDPNVMYYQQGASLHKITLQTGNTWTDSIYFTAPGGAALLSLGGEGDWLDVSGRFMVIRYGPEPSVHLYDRRRLKQPYANPINGAISIDNTHHSVSITPDGQYLVGGGPSLGSQTQCATGNGWGSDAAFSWHINRNRSVDAQPTEFWTLAGSHMDFLSASDGHNYAIVSDYWTPDVWLADITNNALGKCADQQHSLPGNKRLLALGWNDARHTTAVARGPLQNFAFVSSEDVTDTFGSGGNDGNGYITPWRVYKQEIIAINVLTGQIWRVAHHLSRSITVAYAYQPRLSVSWGGEYIGWASNFNQSGIVDIFAVRFNPNVVPAAAPLAPDPEDDQ